MYESEFYEDLLLELRAEKSRQGLTIEQIHERTIDIGEAVSIRTLARLFSPNNADLSFHNKTLFAVAKVLNVDPINGDGSASIATQLRRMQDKIEALEELIKVKDEQIQHRTDEISEYNNQVNSMRKTVYMQQQAIIRKNKLLRVLIIGLAIVSVLMILLLAFDMLTPSLGYFGR